MASTTLTVRPTTGADIAVVDALLARSFPALLKADYPPSLIVTAVPRLARAQPDLLRCGTYYVVEDAEGVVVGAGGWTRAGRLRLRGSGRGVAHVRHVVTDHRRTREGIGRALMARIFQEASADGVGLLECQSTLTARPFYAACGFRELGPVRVPIMAGLDFPAIHMQRLLPEGSDGARR